MYLATAAHVLEGKLRIFSCRWKLVLIEGMHLGWRQCVYCETRKPCRRRRQEQEGQSGMLWECDVYPWKENAFLSPCQPWLPCPLQGGLSKQQQDSDRDQNTESFFSICLSLKISLYAQLLKERHNCFNTSFPFPTLEMHLALQVSGAERRQMGELTTTDPRDILGHMLSI